MVELRVIGELAVVRDGIALALPASKKTRALLGYLAATGKAQLREKLCGLLWDGPDDPRAQLRWSLTKLRPLVELATDRERVALGDARVDLAALRAVGPVAKASTDALVAAAVHARGELLEGLELPACFRFDEWLRGEREAARRLQIAIVAALVDRLPAAEALAHARTWVGLEPLDELAHVAVIRRLVELDRREDALAQYERCARLLEHELGRAPSRELERLRMAIGTVVERVVEPVVADAPFAALPLVGRRLEREALQASFERPRARVTLLLGDPGIGKSHLLDELSRLARERGFRVLRGRGVEAEQVRPYGAWLDALGDEAFRGEGEADRTRLFEAITAWLLAQGRLLVVIDDLQWIDEASAALLHYLARAPAAATIHLACAARPGELADNAQALRLIRGLTREGAIHQIGVSPLDPDDTAALAAQHAPGVDVSRVVAESGGHPLFAVEIARALARGETTWASLDALLADRLALVDGATAREIVPWAAALGGAFDADLLSAITGVPLAELARAIGELERRALVRAAGGEWDFAHDLIRAAAYQAVSAPRRRLLHLQIARTLATFPDPDDANSLAIAHHAGLGGDSLLCARSCLAACCRCLRMFAPEEAAAYADRGLAHVASLVGVERAELRIDLLAHALDADLRRTRRGALAAELRRAILDAQATGADSAVARGWAALSRVAYESGDLAGAATASIDGAERARLGDAVAQGQALAFSAQCLALIGHELPRAEALLGEAAELLSATTMELPELPFALALIRHHQGDVAGAITLLERTIDVALRRGIHWFAGYAWARAGLFELERRRPAQALAYCVQLAEHAALLGDCAELPCGRVIEAAAHLALGDGDPARIEQTLAELRAADAPLLLAQTLLALAEVELATGRPAIDHAHEAIAVANRAERPSEVVLGRALLARIFDGEGMPANALAERALLHAMPVDLLGARALEVLAEL